MRKLSKYYWSFRENHETENQGKVVEFYNEEFVATLQWATGSIPLSSRWIPERIDAVIMTESFVEAWRLLVRTPSDKNFVKLQRSYLVSCRRRESFFK